MKESPLDTALRIANSNAERIERQERLAFFLEEIESPLASNARHLLDIMRGIQAAAIRRLIEAEDEFGRS